MKKNRKKFRRKVDASKVRRKLSKAQIRRKRYRRGRQPKFNALDTIQRDSIVNQRLSNLADQLMTVDFQCALIADRRNEVWNRRERREQRKAQREQSKAQAKKLERMIIFDL